MIIDERVGMLLVVDAREQLVGLSSEHDIVRFVATGGGDASASRVKAAMADISLTASPGDPVAEVLREMTDQRARHVPVMSALSASATFSNLASLKRTRKLLCFGT